MTRQLLAAPQRIVLVGSVFSSERTLAALVRNGAPMVGVLGLEPESARNVSGYRDLSIAATEAGLEYESFSRINSAETVDRIRRWRPDLVFIVGLSQLVGSAILKIPTIGSVGFHPTMLPWGRGRAPLAWLILESGPAAATFFLMDTGVDAGPILLQVPIRLSTRDSATDLGISVGEAIDRGLDRWLPELLSGSAEATLQDESLATYFGRRSDSDGGIDWSKSAAEVDRLIRASSTPYPGAYTYYGNERIRIWSSEPYSPLRYRGVPGRVIHRRSADGALLVQAGDHPFWISSYEVVGDPSAPPIPVGARLGYRIEDEIHQLRGRINGLEAAIQHLLERLERGG
jgi:methionyl-tRNA formyltransferase